MASQKHVPIRILRPGGCDGVTGWPVQKVGCARRGCRAYCRLRHDVADRRIDYTQPAL